jgi:hypothetical protein
VSEIYPSVRLAIRDSVTRILFDRPGQWLTTHELMDHCEEAETSDALAKILSDMAKTGRLMRGLKTLNQQGREVNTWGLSPKLRDKIMSGQLLAQSLELLAKSQDAGHDAPAPVWQIDAPQTTLASLTPPVASLGTDPPPLPLESYEDEAARLPASVAPPDPAPAFTLWADASAAVAAALPFISGATSKTTPSIQETEIFCAHLPVRWLPELRLRLLGYDDRGDPVITLRINTEGHGAYLTLSTHGQIPFDPGELDFLPSLGTALCQFIDALYPYGTTRPAAAATTPSAPEAQP